MTLQSDAAKETAATHTWLHDAVGDEALTLATPRNISIFGLGYVGAVSQQLLLDVAALPDRAAHQARYRGMCW